MAVEKAVAARAGAREGEGVVEGKGEEGGVVVGGRGMMKKDIGRGVGRGGGRGGV